jgi:hypothetical protein
MRLPLSRHKVSIRQVKKPNRGNTKEEHLVNERGITGRLDFEALRRAIERGDPDAMLEFYADAAGVRVLNDGAVSFEVEGKAEVAKYLRAVHARPATHRVENEVLAEGRVHFEESCEYPDGACTVVETRLEVREGEISCQVDVVVGQDERSAVPGQSAERTRVQGMRHD